MHCMNFGNLPGSDVGRAGWIGDLRQEEECILGVLFRCIGGGVQGHGAKRGMIAQFIVKMDDGPMVVNRQPDCCFNGGRELVHGGFTFVGLDGHMQGVDALVGEHCLQATHDLGSWLVMDCCGAQTLDPVCPWGFDNGMSLSIFYRVFTPTVAGRKRNHSNASRFRTSLSGAVARFGWHVALPLRRHNVEHRGCAVPLGNMGLWVSIIRSDCGGTGVYLGGATP